MCLTITSWLTDADKPRVTRTRKYFVTVTVHEKASYAINPPKHICNIPIL